ncbi:hypothetical protein F4774DRAFT_370916 [Daldinia eschscholtzii]|nr:hypothetical protein F4774DRAFT_370916 [Daldinia eschscholtzii]
MKRYNPPKATACCVTTKAIISRSYNIAFLLSLGTCLLLARTSRPPSERIHNSNMTWSEYCLLLTILHLLGVGVVD